MGRAGESSQGPTRLGGWKRGFFNLCLTVSTGAARSRAGADTEPPASTRHQQGPQETKTPSLTAALCKSGSWGAVYRQPQGQPLPARPAWIPPDAPASASASGSLSSPEAGTGMCRRGASARSTAGGGGGKKDSSQNYSQRQNLMASHLPSFITPWLAKQKKNLQVKKVLMVTQHFIHIS